MRFYFDEWKISLSITFNNSFWLACILRLVILVECTPSADSRGYEPGSTNCDIFSGQWIPSTDPVQYSSATCPYISSHQNCLLNGRTDTHFLKWSFKPHGCDLPSFDARKLLSLMRGKSIAFLGDSLSRNQMESLLCLLNEAEQPRIRGNKTILEYFFPKSDFSLFRVWSSWLVHEENPIPLLKARLPKGFKILHLDRPHKLIAQFAGRFDVLVVNSGHWWVKPTAFFHQSKFVGFQRWAMANSTFESLKKLMNIQETQKNAHRSRGTESRGGNGGLDAMGGVGSAPIDKISAFRVAMDTAFRAISAHHRKALVVFRTVTPNHYLGGRWNSGGTCSQFTRPLERAELLENTLVSNLYKIQIETYEKLIVREKTMPRELFLLANVTSSFLVRPDGHPGRFRSGESLVRSGLRFGKVPEDCLHWCLPGPIDTWNQMLFHMIQTSLA